MEKLTISLLIISLISILIFTGIMALTASTLENSEKLLYTHSHTKAICNSENFCQDYEIFCKDQKVIKMSPITGAAIQFSETWQDPRDEKTRNKVC